jgi:hypothetical protein
MLMKALYTKTGVYFYRTAVPLWTEFDEQCQTQGFRSRSNQASSALYLALRLSQLPGHKAAGCFSQHGGAQWQDSFINIKGFGVVMAGNAIRYRRT